MLNHSKDQEAIIALLTRIYGDIVDIEEEFKLIAGAGDMRPRIDYFHDAIRAFTAEGETAARLNVELLAYDLRCLHYIAQMPDAPFRAGGENLSPSQTVATTAADIIITGSRPDRKIRARITDLYEHYAVMFAALLKPAAEHDYHDRMDNLNNDVEHINGVINELANKPAVNVNKIVNLAQKLDEKELKTIIIMFLQQKKYLDNAAVHKLTGHLKDQIKQKDKAIKDIGDAHLRFATTQLSIFENSRDMLKKLANQGTNLVGKFVEASLADTKRQVGR